MGDPDAEAEHFRRNIEDVHVFARQTADWVCHIGTLMPCIEAVA